MTAEDAGAAAVELTNSDIVRLGNAVITDDDGRAIGFDHSVVQQILTERLAAPESTSAALTEEGWDDLHEFVVRWLYNGPQGHRAEPPPQEARADLDCDADNAIEAVRAWDALARRADGRDQGAEQPLRAAWDEIERRVYDLGHGCDHESVPYLDGLDDGANAVLRVAHEILARHGAEQ